MAYTPQIYYPQSAYAPQQYQQMQIAPQMQPQMQQQPQVQNNNGLIWVSGEVGAKSYLVAPNSTVMLMDSEQNRFFIKSTDGAGMPSIKTYEYKECVQNIPQATQSLENNLNEQFVTREEYKAICDKYEALNERIAELQKPKTVRRTEGKSDE